MSSLSPPVAGDQNDGGNGSFFSTVTSVLIWPMLTSLIMCVWIAYITFYNSRVIGSILTWVVNKLTGSAKGHIHIGSFSFSVLSGKIMVRDVAYITEDYTFRCQDALIIMRWWQLYKPLPANADASQCPTRLNVFLFGMEFHCYNRSALYSEMEKKFGLPSQMIPQSNEKSQSHQSSEGNISVSEAASQDTSSQENIWRDFFGVVKFEITSGRLVFGNTLVPTVLVIGVEELRGTYTTISPTYQWDLYTHDINCSVDELRVMLAPSKDYMGRVDKPPRFMGEGFVVCKSSKATIHYYYDEPGVQPSDEEINGEDVNAPCWAMDITCDKSNQITYGPWADRQRGCLHKFFYPQDYKTMTPTDKLLPGQKRQYEKFDLRLNIVSKASLELLFIKNEETHNCYVEIVKGSYVEASIPFVIGQNGYINKIEGQLFFLESATNLAYTPFIKSETLQFDVSMHYPLVWNHHQNWEISLNFNKANWSFIYDHKDFLADIISDWSSKEESDLLTFVPYTVNLNIALKDFEILLPINQYNWIDCSTHQPENVCIGIIGDTLDLSVVLPFSEFRPEIVPLRVLLRAESAVAMLYLPDSYVSRPCLAALDKSAKGSSSWEGDRDAMKIPREMWKDNTSRPGWIEAACAPVVAITILYQYHPVPLDVEAPTMIRKKSQRGHKYTTLPPEQPRGGLRKSELVTEPAAELASDLLHLEIDIGPLSVMAYGSIVKVFLAIKENILGEFQSITRFDDKAYQEIPTDFDVDEKKINPLGLRHLDVTVSLNIDGIKGHLPVHCSKADGGCPTILMEQLCMELQKTYTQTRIQLLLSPILVTVLDTNLREGPGRHLNQGYLGLSGLQLRCHAMFSGTGLPPDATTVEYAWLVDLQLGSLCGKLSPSQALCLVEGIQQFLHLAIDDMDDLKPIEPIKYCVHMIPQKMCNLREAPYGTPCPEESDLKYRMTRLRLTGVQLQIVETDCALDLKVEDVRLASCNAHSRRVKEGLTVTVQDISVHQYVCNPQSGTVWLDAGSVWFGPLNIDLVNFIRDKGMNKAKKHFLKKHDAKSKRLWFLWGHDELTLQTPGGTQDQCGCHGGCMFFTMKRRESLRHGDPLAMPGLMWRPDSLHGGSHFGESLLQKGQVAFDACDRTPDDSPTKMFKFTRGWVHSSPSSSPDEVDTQPMVRKDDQQDSVDNASKSVDKNSIQESESRDVDEDGEKEKDDDEVRVGEVEDSEGKGTTVKRAASLNMRSTVKGEAEKLMGSSYSLPTSTFQVKVEPDDGDERSRRRRSRAKSSGAQSSSDSISDSEYYSAEEDAESEKTAKKRTKSVSDTTSVSKVTQSPTTTEVTSTYSSAQSPVGDTTNSSLKVESPSRKVSTSSTISYRSVRSGQKGSKERLIEKEVIASTFAGYLPYLNHNRCQEWLKTSPSAVESWRTTDPYSQPFCGNFLRTGVMSPPQFHVLQVGLGPNMIAERPRDSDLEEMDEDFQQQEASSDEDEEETSKVKVHSSASAVGTAIKADIEGPINIMMTPLFLDAANRLLQSAVGSLTSQHPGALLESIHHNSITHALKTAKKVQKKGELVNAVPSETKVTVIIPQINLCMVQAQPTLPESEANHASLLVLHLELLTFNLMTLRSKPIEDQFTPSPNQDASPGHTSTDASCQPLLDSMVSSLTLSQAHSQMRRLQEGRNVFDEFDCPTAIPVQHSRVSFCLDPLDFESLKRGTNNSMNISEDMVPLNITTTIMAEGGVEDIVFSMGNGVEKMGRLSGGKRKLVRALSKEYAGSPPSSKRKLLRSLSREESPSPQKKGKSKNGEVQGEKIGKGATSITISVDSFWNHVPTPPHPRREQTASLLDFNLLTTASPALDSWLNSASNLKFLMEKTQRNRHQRNMALMTFLMAESHESLLKPELPKNKNHYSKLGEAIISDLSCQLVLVLWNYMIQMNEEEAEESTSIDNIPAITTLENGARVLLRQWKVNLLLLNPGLSTMNFLTKQPGYSVEDINKLDTLDTEGHMETSDATILDDIPSDGSALCGTRTSMEHSDQGDMSGYRSQIYSKLQVSMYDEFSDRKRTRTTSGMSSQTDGAARTSNMSYSRLPNMKTSSSTGSMEGSVFSGKAPQGYLPLPDLERVAELSTGSMSSMDENILDDDVIKGNDIPANNGYPAVPMTSSPGPTMSPSATQIGDIEVIFKPVLKYFNLNTNDKVSALKQIVEVVGQLSVLFTLEEFEICITKTSSKAMKEKHAKKLSRGKTFQRRDSPAFSCQNISLRLSIQESLREIPTINAGDGLGMSSSPGVKQEGEISGNIEVVTSVHFGTVLQIVNMAILRLIIQVAQVIKNFQRAKTDLMLKEYLSSLHTDVERSQGQSSSLRPDHSPHKKISDSKGKSNIDEHANKVETLMDQDDLESLSSRSGSETIPRCWQTMYHLLNLYNTPESEDDGQLHIYENPILTFENENGDNVAFFRNRHISEDNHSPVDSDAAVSPTGLDSSSSSIGLSVTCTVGVDEVCVLAELAGLHLEVEVFDICLGLTATQSLLNQAYPGFVKKLPDVSASLQSPSISVFLSKTSKADLMTIASLIVETPQLSGAMTSEELTTIHVTSLFSIKDIVLEVPLDITMLTDVAAESSKKLAFRIRQLQQADRSYQTNNDDFIPPIVDSADAMASDNSGVDPFSYRNNIWIVSKVAKIDSISIQASLLPQLFTQYLIEDVSCTLKWKGGGMLYATVPKHTLKFLAKSGDTESSAEVSFPQISFKADVQNPSSGTPDLPTASRTSQKNLLNFNAVLEVESFNHNLTSNLLNYILIVQRILAQELSVLTKELQNFNWPSLEDLPSKNKPSDQPKRPFCVYTLLIHFKGLQLTASSPSSSAVRLETGVVELELSNKKEEKGRDDDTDSLIDDGVIESIRIHAKALIELNLSLGTLVRNPVYLEAEPDFEEVAYFKTKIGLTNSPKGQSSEGSANNISGSGSSGKQTFLVSLIKPVLFIQPHAVDKGLMVWMSYKGAYEQFIQQWQDADDEGLLIGPPPSTSSSQAHLPMVRRRPVPTQTTFLFQLIVKEVAICVPFVQTHQMMSASASKSDLENPAALIVSLESSLVSAHFRTSLVTKGVFNSFCLRFTENFQSAMDDWLPDMTSDLYNACCVPHGSFEVGSKVDVASDPSHGQWKVGFRWHMKGVDIKVDPSIGHYLSGLANTMTSITGSEDVADLTSVTETQEGSSNDALSDQEGKTKRPGSLKLKEEEVKKSNFEIIKELNEQAKVVSDLKTLGAKSGTIKEETERLAKLELEAQRDAKRAMRKKLFEMGKSMARRDDMTKKKKDSGEKLTPTEEGGGKTLLERRQTLLQMKNSTAGKQRTVSSVESPNLKDGIPTTPYTPSTPFTPSDKFGHWWTERKAKRQSVTLDSRGKGHDLNITVGDPSRFQDELMVRRRRFILQSTLTYDESDSGSGSELDSGDDKDAVDGGISSKYNGDDEKDRLFGDTGQDGGTEAEAGSLEPDIHLDLDVIINIDSGKLSFICFQKAEENPEFFFRNSMGDKKAGTVPAWIGKSSAWPDAPFPTQVKPPQGITFFAIPSVDVKAHYSSQQDGDRSVLVLPESSLMSPNTSKKEIGQQKRGVMYVWAQMKSPEDEIIVTTSILDFMEQALKVIPPAPLSPTPTSPTANEPASPQKEVRDIDASTNSLVSSSAVDYTTFPVDVVVYFLVQPSVIHLTCLPASRVECLLQLPCTELSFSSTEFADDIAKDSGERFKSPTRIRQLSGDDMLEVRKSTNSGLHCSIVLSNFSLVVFHPYGEQLRKDLNQRITEQQSVDPSEGGEKPQVSAASRRDALSLEVSLIKVNISSERSREFPHMNISLPHGSPMSPSTSPAKTIINKFSIICDMGSASFQYDMRRLTEMLAFPKAWYRKSLAKRLFLGKEARSPDEEESSDHSGSQTDDELSSSTSSSDSEDSFSHLPSRTVNRGSSVPRSSYLHTPPSPTSGVRPRDAVSSGDEEDASPSISHKRKAVLPSRRARLESIHTRSIQDKGFESAERTKSLKRESRPHSPQISKQDKAPKWKTVVVIAINVDKLDTNINMSNVMGTTVLTVQELRGQSNILMDSNNQRDLHIISNLASLSLESKGGVVGGLLNTKGLHVEVLQKKLKEREPHHNIKVGVELFACRLDYMGSSSLLANLTGLQVSEKDEWKCTMQGGKDRQLESMYTNTVIIWDSMHLIICRSTTPDILKSYNRLEEFISQQLQSSKKMLSSWKPPGLESSPAQDSTSGKTSANVSRRTTSTVKTSSTTPKTKRKLKRQQSSKVDPEDETISEGNHWQTIFKWCSQVFGGQTSSLCQGLQLGGQITLQGKKAVVTCFHGLNFRSSSWALFTLREPHIQFETNAFELPPEQGQTSRKTLVVQNLLFDLGHNQTQREDGWLAMINRVYRNEKSHFPFNGTIDECFQYVSAIKCPDEIEQFMQNQKFFPPVKSSSYKHKADPIFALPKLQVVMESKQTLQANVSDDVEPRKVQVTFVTTFTDHLYVSMDVELLLFLHDLVIAYMEYKDKAMSLQQQSSAGAVGPPPKSTPAKTESKKPNADQKEKEDGNTESPSSPSRDKREFNCSTWQLEPTVRLLSWGGKQIEPVGADYILNKLGFKHARTTIPKWIQRGVMDPSDLTVSLIVREMLKMMDEGTEEEKNARKT